MVDELGFGQFLAGLEALAAGTFGELAIGDPGQAEEGAGWIVEQLLSRARVYLPKGAEGIESGEPLGGILKC